MPLFAAVHDNVMTSASSLEPPVSLIWKQGSDLMLLLEDVYFRLQAEYRDAQSQVNSMKHDCRKAIEESAIAARTEYAKAMAEWNNERKLIEARHAEHIQIRSKELEALRIRIPQSLTEIYEHVSNLGKKRDNRSHRQGKNW